MVIRIDYYLAREKMPHTHPANPRKGSHRSLVEIFKNKSWNGHGSFYKLGLFGARLLKL